MGHVRAERPSPKQRRLLNLEIGCEMHLFRTLTFLVVTILLSGPVAHAANLLQNPSFEDPVRTEDYTFLHTGDDIGGVWFVTEHVFDVGHVRHFSSFPEPYPDGDQMIYVGDDGLAGTVVQPISTALSAGDYSLSFWQGNTVFFGAGEVRIQLAPITGGSGFLTTYGPAVYDQLFTLDESSALGWYHQVDNIDVPTDGFYGLFIIGATDSGEPTVIDMVSLTAVPEPSSLALVATVVATLSVVALRRKRSRKNAGHA
jgi:hypothetical protein